MAATESHSHSKCSESPSARRRSQNCEHLTLREEHVQRGESSILKAAIQWQAALSQIEWRATLSVCFHCVFSLCALTVCSHQVISLCVLTKCTLLAEIPARLFYLNTKPLSRCNTHHHHCLQQLHRTKKWSAKRNEVRNVVIHPGKPFLGMAEVEEELSLEEQHVRSGRWRHMRSKDMWWDTRGRETSGRETVR